MEEKSTFGDICVFCTTGAIAIVSIVIAAVLLWVMLM